MLNWNRRCIKLINNLHENTNKIMSVRCINFKFDFLSYVKYIFQFTLSIDL